MLKKLVLVLLCLSVVLGLAACGVPAGTSGALSGGKVKVTVTFNALKDLPRPSAEIKQR